jgi:hypothetical protein
MQNLEERAFSITLADELAHVVYRWPRWKEDLADQSHKYLAKKLMEYTANVHATQWEPCFDIHHMKLELGDALEDFTLDGHHAFSNGLVCLVVASRT